MWRFTLALAAMALVGLACSTLEVAREGVRCGDAGPCRDGALADAAGGHESGLDRDGGTGPSAQRDGGEPADAGPDAASGGRSGTGGGAGTAGTDGAVGGSGGTGDEDAATDAASGGTGATGGSAGSSSSVCDEANPCDGAFNCEQHACVEPTVSCNAHKNAYPSAPDGVRWISPSGTPMRAYCDMAERVELCTEIEGDHRGVTRDGSRLAYSLRSVLIASEGIVRSGHCATQRTSSR